VGKMQILVALGGGCSVGTTVLPAGWAVVVPAAETGYRLRGVGDVVRIACP
jgi:hypothetical protein